MQEKVLVFNQNVKFELQAEFTKLGDVKKNANRWKVNTV